MRLPSIDFESIASTIPPPRQASHKIIKHFSKRQETLTRWIIYDKLAIRPERLKLNGHCKRRFLNVNDNKRPGQERVPDSVMQKLAYGPLVIAYVIVAVLFIGWLARTY